MDIQTRTEKCYCISFRRTARAVTAYYDRMLSPSGITINQYSLLLNLYRIAPCSVSTLAKAMRLDRTTLVRNIKPLIGAGLIQDLAKEGERDRQLIISGTGLATLEAAQKLWEKAQAGLKKHIDVQELEKLANTIAAEL